MMILSTKITKAKILTAALVCACIALIIIVSIPPAESDTSGNTYSAKTNEERISFLENFGWEVAAEPIEVVDVIIPTSFDETYDTYNKLQESQGLDLEAFKGMKAKRYTYKIENYPDEENSEIHANLLVSEDRIIAGDVSSVDLGGFMHGLAKPTQGNVDQTQTQTADQTIDQTPEVTEITDPGK